MAANQAYLDGLKLLARRELSEAQVRQRLTRRGHSSNDIDDAVARLRTERAIDDERAAAAIARTESSGRGRGKLRVRLQIERAGISRTIAKRAVEDAFADLDDQSQLQTALNKRLRGRRVIADERELQRLYRYLVGQGFDPDRVMALLGQHKR